METGKARALIYGYSVLAGIIQDSDLDRRFSRLEAALEERHAPP